MEEAAEEKISVLPSLLLLSNSWAISIFLFSNSGAISIFILWEYIECEWICGGAQFRLDRGSDLIWLFAERVCEKKYI